MRSPTPHDLSPCLADERGPRRISPGARHRLAARGSFCRMWLAAACLLAPSLLWAGPPAPAPADGLRLVLPPGARLQVQRGSAADRRQRLAFAPTLDRAEEAAIGQLVPLGTGETQEHFWPPLHQSVALLRGGGFATVWGDGPGTARGVRLQYVRPDGSLVLPAGGIELADGSSDIFLSVVAAHPTSGAFVAFGRWSRGGQELIVQSVDGAGAGRWPGEGVSAFGPPGGGHYHHSFQLVPIADGGVFVCAARDHYHHGRDSIHCQRLTAGGQRAWGDDGVEAGERLGWRILPQAIADGAGGVIVVWLNNRVLDDDRVDPRLVEGQRLAADGRRLWGARGKVLRTTNLTELAYFNSHVHSNDLFAVSDGAGGAIVAHNDWDRRMPATLDVFAQRVAGDGRLLWGRGLAVASGKVPQQVDGLVPVPGGGAVVGVWEPRTSTYGPLRLYRLGPGGSQLWGAAGRSLSGPAAQALDFSAFGQIDGNTLRTAWVHQQTPNTHTFDIYVAEHKLNGARLTPPNGLPLYTGPLTQFLRGFVFDAARGAGLAVFEDYRPNEADSYDTLGALYTP